jgi:Phage tail tube protein
MAIPSGLAAQVGYKTETTYGTAVTVDRFVPLVSESLSNEIERIESDAIIAGARLLRSEQWQPGNINVAGDVQHELFQQGVGLLFEHMLGARNTSGAGPYTHTYTPGDLTTKGFTTQVGKPRVDGTVQAFTYSGCKVAEWEIALEAGKNATLGLTLLGQQEATATALATATFLAGQAKPFIFTHGTVTIGGSPVKVRSVTISGNNGLADDRRNVGQAFIDEPIESGLREITGTITMEFKDLTEYTRYVNGTEFAAVLALNAGAAAQATITMNARYDGATPAVGGRELVVVDVPFKVIGTTTDALGITAVLINNQTTG